LYAAGGVTERANLRAVEVRRFGKSIATLDLYDYLLRGDTKSDIRLETGTWCSSRCTARGSS